MRIVAIVGLVLCALVSPVLAQFATPLPSQVAPQERRPPLEADTMPVIPLPLPASPMDGAGADLHIRLAAVDVTGAFDEAAWREDRFAAITGHVVSLSDIRRAVAALQAAYDNAGYALVRIVVPPQTLRDGGRMQIRVVDGYIESVQADGVPETVRATVRARLAGLVGQRRLRWSQLERQVLLAGSVPGLRLGSALLPGTAEAGVRLVVDGSFEAASVRVGADTELPFSLGGREINASLVLNSPVGLGEQWLVSQTRGLGGAVHGRPPLNSTAFGVVMPIGPAGLTATPQVVRVDTAPMDTPGAPTSTGAYRRESLTIDYPLWAQRAGRLDAEGSIEHVAQWQRAVDFGIDLSRDIYRALRLQMSAEFSLSPRNAVSAKVSAGLGFGGRTQAQAAESGIPMSRLGASSNFRKLGLDVTENWSCDGGWTLDTRVLAQSSLGHPLLRPELLALDGAGQVSAFRAGDLAFDQGLLTRIELQRTAAFEVQGGHWTVRPYAFVAAGHGHLFQATELEATVENARAAGLGWRSDSFDMARNSSLHLELEGSRGWLEWSKPRTRTTWIALAAWRF